MNRLKTRVASLELRSSRDDPKHVVLLTQLPGETEAEAFIRQGYDQDDLNVFFILLTSMKGKANDQPT